MKSASTGTTDVTPLACALALSASSSSRLMFVGGDDQLAASRVRNGVGFAEAIEAISPLDAQHRLEGARGIVEAGVDDAAVVRAGGAARFRFALDERHRRAELGQRQRRRKPGHASADHRDIHVFHASSTILSRR